MLWGELAGPLEPCSAWVVPGWRWASEEDDTVWLPTFTRAIPRTRPPPGAPGLHKISDVARARYFRDALRFPPYTYEDHLCFVREADAAFSWQDPGAVRVALASERETLMGFMPAHTSHAIRGRVVGDGTHRDADTVRCALVGNSFHTLSVAVILGSQFAELGFHSVYCSPKALQERFFQELSTHSQQVEAHMASEMEAAGLIIEPLGMIAGDALKAEELLEAFEHRGDVLHGDEGGVLRSSEHELLLADVRDLRWLAESHVRASEPRGGEIRADLAVPMRPRAGHRVSVDSRRWSWHHVVSTKVAKRERCLHINQLELKAIRLALDYRLRSQTRRKRFLHLVDSQVALAVVCKGRTSSRRLLPEARRIAARCIAAGLHPTYAYVRSKWNASDEPSRARW